MLSSKRGMGLTASLLDSTFGFPTLCLQPRAAVDNGVCGMGRE